MTGFSTRQEPGLTVVDLEGRLDIAGVEEVRPLLLAAARDSEARMVVRMGGVTFLDSTGLGALVALQKTLAHQGKLLLLAELQPQARMVLRITHLEWILTCYDSYEEALAA
jgi:anti-sigma B factor antagonist